MAALSLWVRRTWIRRWLGLLGLGLMIAVVGGVTLAVTAGARRTASAFHRLETATNAPTMQVELAQPDNRQPGAVPPTCRQRRAWPRRSHACGASTGVAVASFMGATPDPDGSWFAVVAGEARGAAPA